MPAATIKPIPKSLINHKLIIFSLSPAEIKCVQRT